MLDGLRRIAVKTVLTSGPGHAVELALEAQAYGGVVAVGGDGTLFEILKGIDRKEQRIALIPAGRGNSLARDLGLLHRRALLDVIHWEQARFIDLMAVHVTTADGVQSRHLSASTVGLGYPAAVTLRARKLAMLGRMSYAAAAAATRPVHFSARIQYEDGTPREVWLNGFIANNTRHLANFQAFCQASCSDGLFETMEMNAGIAKQTLHNLSALSGTGAFEPYASRQARNAKIQLNTPQNLMMDGELFPQVVSVDIRILPSALVCNGPGAA
jgi:diacylglycerol kinase family enzyme